MFCWLVLLSLVSSATAQNCGERPDLCCDYQCNNNDGGCTVKYVGPPRAGKVSGSCFPQSFGGSCSGTPRECQDCNRVISCGEGGGTLSTSSQGGSELLNIACKNDWGCAGGNIGPPGKTSSATECRDRCANDRTCEYFTRNAAGDCYLQTREGSCRRIADWTQGSKNCVVESKGSKNSGHQQCGLCSVEGYEVWNKLQDVANWLSEYSQNNNGTNMNASQACVGAPTNTVNTATTTTTVRTTGFQSFNNYETTFEEKVLNTNAPLKEKNEEAMAEIYQSFKGIRNKNLQACTDQQSCDPQKKKFQEEVNSVLDGLASIQQQVLGYLNRRDRPRKNATRVARQAPEVPGQRSTPEGRRLTKEIQTTNDQLFEKLTSLEENINQQRPSCGSNSEKDLAKVKHLAAEMTKKIDAEPTAFREPKDAWRQLNREDCWPKCDRKGGLCEEVCGPKGYCCRKGWKNECPAGAVNASPDYHSCVKLTRTTSGGDKTVGGAAAETANTPPLETEYFRRCEPFFGYGFVDENGHTEHHDIVPGESFEECEKHCLENYVCEAWTYDKKDKFCYLKDAEMSNSLGDTWNMDLVSSRMESCIYQVDFCLIVMDGEILVNSDSDYMNQKSALAKPLKDHHKGIDTKCLDDLATTIQKDKRTIKTCITDEDEDRNELWIPIATLCKDELIELSQEIIDNHLTKLDWRKMEKLSAEDHDAVMWIAKLELIDLVGSYSNMAHSLNIDTTKSRRTSAIVPGTKADGAKVLAGSGLTNRRKVRDIEKAIEIADEIKAIDEDTTLTDLKKKQALQKKRDQGLQAIDSSPALTGEEKERAKQIFSQDSTESDISKINVEQELATLKGKSKWEKIKNTALRRDQNNIQQAPNSAIAPTANTVNNGMTAAASSSNARSASQQSLSSQQSSTSVNSQQSATTTNSQQAATAPNGQQPPSTTAAKPKGKKRRQAGKVAAGLGEAASVGVGAVQKFIAGDPLNVVSGILDIATMAAAFIPPPVGLIASGVFGVANAVLSIFSGPQGPSDLEIMTELINEQTEVIKESIEQQTDILLESFKRLAKQNVRNTETIINTLKTTNFHLLVDEIQGSIQSLVVKMKHLQNYKHTCILDWSDIAGEASLEEAVVKMGRVASYARRFCSSMGNLDFCGVLIYQYILLSVLRQRVQAQAIDIVRRSAFHNNQIKVRGLNAEFQAAQDMDWNLLQDILLSRGNNTCHMGCAFHASLQEKPPAKERFSTLAQKEFECAPKAKDCKPNKYQIKRTGINAKQTAIVLRFLEKLGINSPSEVFESNIHAKDAPEKSKKFADRLDNFCRACYSNMPCEGDAEPSPGKKGVRRGGLDGSGTKREEFTEPKKDEAKKLCATYYNEHKNNKRQIYIPAGNPDVKRKAKDASSSQWWGYVYVETRCTLTIYVEKNFKSTKEKIDKKSKYHGDGGLGVWWRNDVRSYECECA